LATTYRLAEARVGVSSGVADDLANLSGIRRDLIDVVYNPVFVPNDQRGPLEFAPAQKVAQGNLILTVGSLKAAKNHALLIRAFARIATSTDATLMLLGEGHLRRPLEELALAEGVADRVVMPGFVTD